MSSSIASSNSDTSAKPSYLFRYFSSKTQRTEWRTFVAGLVTGVSIIIATFVLGTIERSMAELPAIERQITG